MRRLLLLQFVFCFTFAVVAQKNPCDQKGVPYSSLPGDTTIVLRSGTTITFNRCEFFDIKDCIEIKDIETPEDMERERLGMYDDEGSLLLSYGMIVIKLDGCKKTTFEVPVKFRMKIAGALSCFDTTKKIVPLLFINRASGWSTNPDIKSGVITINGERFIEFETRSPGGAWNLDVLKKGRLVKFKTPKGFTIRRLKLGMDCPLFFINKFPEKKRRSLHIKLRCASPESVAIEYSLDHKNKDTLPLKQKTRLISLKHGQKRLKCGDPKHSFFGRLFDWRPKTKGEFRKKYYL